MLVKLAQSIGLLDREKYQATTYNADKSCYNFSTTNLNFSEVKGFFKEAAVKGLFDPYNVSDSFLEISWPVTGIKTGILERDKQLIEASHFLFGEEYPEIIFKSHSFSKYSKKQICIKGTLSIKDIKKELTLYASYKSDKLGYIMFVDHELDRFDFEIGESGSFAMGRQIKLQIDIALNY